MAPRTRFDDATVVCLLFRLLYLTQHLALGSSHENPVPPKLNPIPLWTQAPSPNAVGEEPGTLASLCRKLPVKLGKLRGALCTPQIAGLGDKRCLFGSF